MPPRLFNGHGTEFVTVKNRNFRHDRIFATFAGVLFRRRDTFSPAKNVLVASAHARRIGPGVRRTNLAASVGTRLSD